MTTDFVIDDKRIPPPDINFNQDEKSSAEKYIDAFRRDSCLRLLPFLIRNAGLTPHSALLDYGCGLGRLAYAASHYLDPNGAYYGYEPNQPALRFLRSAYNDLQNFHFGGVELSKEADYIAVKEDRANEGGAREIDVRIADLVADRSVDVQFSSSVCSPICGWSRS